MTYALEPQQVLAHYRVTGILGAGGMGEVYLAHDLTLERNVALKILPPALVENEQRLRRFILEAKSASSLNHPNIVTIYEIGQAEVQGADGVVPATATAPAVHFIAMELVAGETLADTIHHQKTDLRTVVGYLAQAAEGLAKAHAAGIVHRDLKPGNIMVTKDGFAKVLDFGLAKLTERGTSSSDETTVVPPADLTGDGVVVGTTGYMSPEQVAGKTVDARSDIFSFGCLLYEAAARQRPFVGDTTVDTLHKILNEKPKPVEELNPRVPADLRKVIRRCLAKSPEQRYQSIKDVAIELRETADQWETLRISGTSDSTAAGVNATPLRQRRRRVIAGAVAVVFILLAVTAAWFVVPRLRTGPAAGGDPLQTRKISSIVSGNDLSSPALSPDARYLAYVKRAGGRTSILVRQVATGSDVQVVEPQQAPLMGLSFSPDGQYLYYLSVDFGIGMATLFAVPSLGGSPRKVVPNVDTAVSFSPDGKRFAFLRGVPRTNEIQLIVFDSAAGTERTLGILKPPEQPVDGGIRWSEDGRRISVAVSKAPGTSYPDLQVLAFDVETGQREAGRTWPHLAVAGTTWLPGDELLASVFEAGMDDIQQLQLLAKGAEPRRVTSDQNSYINLSVSADRRTVAALRVSETRTLWSVPVSAAGEPRQVPITVSNPSLLAVTADGTIVFRRVDGDRGALWTARPDGSGLRQITPDNLFVTNLCAIPGKTAVVFQVGRSSGASELWRVEADGANLVQLPRGPDPSWLQEVAPDGRHCLFSQSAGQWFELYRLPLDGGGMPVPLDRNPGANAATSPDGKLVARFRYQFGEQSTTGLLVVIPAEGGDPIATLKVSIDERGPVWAGDSSAVAYVTSAGGVQTIMRWPIAGGAATPLFRFPQGKISRFHWSRDGRTVLFVGGTGQAANLWTWSAGTAEPRQLTRFPAGDLGPYSWSPDGKTVHFNQALKTNDIVLIRGIQ